MVDLLVSSEPMVIESHKGKYSVTFCEKGAEYLVNNLSDQNYHIIIDKRVAELYSSELNSILSHNSVLQIIALESNKSLEVMSNYVNHLVNKQIRRGDILIAIGGGIIQDITCFLAATLLRGIDWHFYPTTLLAQADSCIGGKTSINLKDIKNIIGGFNPPVKIYLDFKFLETLSQEDIKSGIGEMLHFYFYSNSPYIEMMMGEYNSLLNNPKKLVKYIIESLTIKKMVIEIDEFDKDERNKFNYGHTFGHAIETATNYRIKHGQAVTVGMDIANYISYHYGFMDEINYKKTKQILEINFPKYNWLNFDNSLFLESLSKDKKNEGIKLGCILSKEPGKLSKEFLLIDEKFKLLIKNYFENIE